MVLMAAADSDHHRHHHHHHEDNPKAAKVKAKPAPAAPVTTRPRLHDFTFPATLSWGTHRLLRCSKDGAPAPTSPSPPPQPHTPSPNKEKPQGAPAQAPRPWNLRTRRSATAAPLSVVAGSEKAAAQQQPLTSPTAQTGKRVGFSVALTKEEIAEDFLAIRGARPPRRPKKRPRAVQRQIDMLFPGSSLANVNVDSYKIEER